MREQATRTGRRSRKGIACAAVLACVLGAGCLAWGCTPAAAPSDGADKTADSTTTTEPAPATSDGYSDQLASLSGVPAEGRFVDGVTALPGFYQNSEKNAANAEAKRENDKMRAEQTPVGPGVLADVPLQNVDWLVPDLLPRGELSLLGADGGTGKGLWQAQLIACVTTGKTSGFFPVPPAQTGKVLILAGEDDPGKVLKARLLAAGADMNRVLCLTADDYFQRTGQPLTLKDEALAKFAAKAGPLLLIVDPLQSFLPAGVEMASRNQMRSILLPLKAIAAAQRCAVLLVMHSNKKMGVSGRARLADSSDIWDMARSVLMMGRAKNDGKIYLSHEKNSYARPQQTVLLHIDDVEVEGVRTARAVFDGYTDKKDADFIEERRVRTAETRQDTRSAILNVLSESRLGSMPSNELRAAVLREIGCSDSTYNRVYSDLTKSSQIAKQAIRGKDGRNRWYTCYCGETSDKVPF